MVTTRQTTTRSANTRKAKAKRESRQTTGKTTQSNTKAMSAEALRDRILTGVQRKYKIELPTREQRMATKIGHAVREKLGKDIQSKVDNFDWREWNTKIFPKLFGEPDQLKYPMEMIAEATALIYDSISDDTTQAIADLIEFNAQSLRRRNELAKQLEQEDELDDLDDEVDDLLDEVDEDDSEEIDDDFELDEDEEDDDFELDEEDY